MFLFERYCLGGAYVDTITAIYTEILINLGFFFLDGDRGRGALVNTGLASGTFLFVYFCGHGYTSSFIAAEKRNRFPFGQNSKDVYCFFNPRTESIP
jgi:hypothetical protein